MLPSNNVTVSWKLVGVPCSHTCQVRTKARRIDNMGRSLGWKGLCASRGYPATSSNSCDCPVLLNLAATASTTGNLPKILAVCSSEGFQGRQLR